MSTPAVELLAGNTNDLEEVEEKSDEMRLYREYYMSSYIIIWWTIGYALVLLIMKNTSVG